MSAVHISWHSFDLRSGRRGPPVQIQNQGVLRRVIGEAAETSLSVLCHDEKAPVPGWDEGTLPGRTMLVALDQDEKILWGGMVLRRNADTGSWVQVAVHTLEHYLQRRYVGDLVYTATDIATVAAGVIAQQNVDGLTFTVDAPVTGHVLEEALYADTDDKTIASVLETLSGETGGLEYTVELAWADTTHTVLTRTVVVRQRIGTSRALTTMWEFPGPVTDFAYVEGYGEGEGATVVLASSSGEGSVRPMSQKLVATALIANGWARFERRFSPGASITDDAVLDRHAATELAKVQDGLTQLSLVAHLDSAPRLNMDWWLGDDITAVITAPRFPARAGPDGDKVPGYTRRLRAVGVEIDLEQRTLTPITREVS